MKIDTRTDEKDLLQKLRDGDYTAFDTLYNTHAKKLLHKLNRLVLLPEVAEELHQDIFMAIWTDRERLPLDIPFQSVLYRKANNFTADFYRKASRDLKLQEQLIAGSTELYDELEEHLNFKETNDLVMAAIAKLPEQRQKVFMRVKLEGKSYEEVANEFGVSVSTIKDHMTKGLKSVRAELLNQYPSILFLIVSSTILDAMNSL